MAILIFVGYLLLNAEVNLLNRNMHELHEDIYYRNREVYLHDIANTLDQFYREFNYYPSSLEDLETTNKYQHIRMLRANLPRLIYKTTSISGPIVYQRFLLAEQSPDHIVSEDEYLSGISNECGGNSFEEAGDFCGKRNSLWYIADNRNKILTDKMTATKSLDETLSVILKYHGTSLSDLAGTITNGDAITLAEAVGYSGTLANCSGFFDFYGAVLSCSDLFNQYGIPITYNYISENHIALLSELIHKNASGTPIYVARDIRI